MALETITIQAVMTMPSPFGDHVVIEQIDDVLFRATGVSSSKASTSFMEPACGDLASLIDLSRKWAVKKRIGVVQVLFRQARCS